MVIKKMERVMMMMMTLPHRHLRVTMDPRRHPQRPNEDSLRVLIPHAQWLVVQHCVYVCVRVCVTRLYFALKCLDVKKNPLSTSWLQCVNVFVCLYRLFIAT